MTHNSTDPRLRAREHAPLLLELHVLCLSSKAGSHRGVAAGAAPSLLIEKLDAR